MKEDFKISQLRIKFPQSPFFYNEKGIVYLCSCGNVADHLVATPTSSDVVHTDCFDCMKLLKGEKK